MVARAAIDSVVAGIDMEHVAETRAAASVGIRGIACPTRRYGTISQSNPIQSSIQSNPIQSNPIQSNPTQSNHPIQSNPIQSSIQSK